jgi:hypothetical protein
MGIGNGLAGHLSNDRVPVRVGGKVRENLPHSLSGRVNDDISHSFRHENLPRFSAHGEHEIASSGTVDSAVRPTIVYRSRHWLGILTNSLDLDHWTDP